MKQCPYCKKNIPDTAKVCPHCGKSLQKGYKPMKRTNSYSNSMYILLALFLIFSPMISTLLFGNLLGEEISDSTISTPKKAITLKKLDDVEYTGEQLKYYFGSLDDFDKLVTNSDKYVEKIENFETSLKNISAKYGDIKIKKDYNFYVSNYSNVYSELDYQLSADNYDISITLNYDLSGKVNSANIIQNTEGLANFEELKIKDDSYSLFKEIVSLINGNQEYQSFNKTALKFNDLENDFTKRSESLGNYGLGVSDSDDESKTSMRVLDSSEGYRFKITCDTEINLKQFK